MVDIVVSSRRSRPPGTVDAGTFGRRQTDVSWPSVLVQERVGQDGRAFQLLKFRSMPVNAEAESGPVWTRYDDVRPTRRSNHAAVFARRTSAVC